MKSTTDIDYEFTHRYGGNGFAIVQDLGNNYYKVAPVTHSGVGKSAFLAWGKFLERSRRPINPGNPKSPEEDIPLTGEVLEKVRELREKIATGQVRIANQNLVAA